MTGGGLRWAERESQVLPGVKVTRGRRAPDTGSLGLRHVFSGHRAQEAAVPGLKVRTGLCRLHPEEPPHFPRQVHRRPSTRRRAPVRPRAPLKRRPARGSPSVIPAPLLSSADTNHHPRAPNDGRYTLEKAVRPRFP
ncbi:hypothetical protein Cadr_000002540 [Camelus dromedarius]|uniref:Uncharacterized protein n=1 Tax=Camelus dromedarius TaxID=9838 RepID=A0A5N4C0K0_CAMDR|nr:hypothetical protein Cadr_000002540 [Camelus dromedarius]